MCRIKRLIPSHTDEPIDSDDDDGSSIHGGMAEDFNLPSSDEDDADLDVVDELDVDDSAIADDSDFDADAIQVNYSSDSDHDNENGADEGNSEDSDSDSDDEDCNVNMSELFNNQPNMEANRNHPPNISTDSSVIDVCFHPERDILAAATMDGECIIYGCSMDKTEELKRLTHHQKSCRAVCYSDDGSLLYTISKDKSMAVMDAETYSMKTHMKDAHEAPIYSFFSIDNNICATGDDDGLVKLWDLRSNKSVFEFKCGEQTVSAMTVCSDNKYLAAAVMDGSLTGINLKSRRMEAQSEMFEAEFVSLSLIRNDSKLVVGTSTGMIYIFRWGYFGLNDDAMKGHPDQITSQVAIGDNTVITGCEDGSIRAINIQPNRFDGIIGQHVGGFGIENLSVSHDGRILASCAMDDAVQFWNIEYLYKRKVVRYKRNGNLLKNKLKNAHRNLQSSRKRSKGDFFFDLNNAPDDEDDSVGPAAGTSYDPDKD